MSAAVLAAALLLAVIIAGLAAAFVFRDRIMAWLRR